MGRAVLSRPFRFAGIVLALLLAPSLARAADKVTVTYASFDALYAPYFLACDRGYFAGQDIDAELMQAGGGTSTPIDKVYDYSFVEQAIAALDKGGWKP
jgi:ABC-type nitrate/sulfonate/bicarbonate transport system substrate-binding protein